MTQQMLDDFAQPFGVARDAARRPGEFDREIDVLRLGQRGDRLGCRVRRQLQIAEDANNDGAIQAGEVKFWRPSGEGNSFAIPPVGINTASVAMAVVGSQLKSVNGLPSVIFHRDGSTNSDVEIYIQNSYKSRVDYRAVTVTRSTGRSELYRLAGTGSGAKWLVVQ